MEYIHKSVVNITKKRIKMLQTVYRFQSSHTSVKERNLYTEKIKKYDYTSYDDDVPYYTMIVTEDGNKIKLLLDLTEEMLHTIKMQHPQKVYFA